MRVTPIPCLSDNYAYLLVDPETKEAAIVDVSESGPVLRALGGDFASGASESAGELEGARLRAPSNGGGDDDRRERAKIVAILSTHHHPDHVGGNEEVKAKLGIEKVYGYATDKGRIPGQTNFLEEGQTFTIGSLLVRAIHIPGHTLGAVAYVVTREPHDPIVFTGDTLFVGGCGRIFEGDPPMMHRSLQKLAKLDGRTKIYCGHEYTEANLRFAAHVEPSNGAIEKARARASELRKAGKTTMGATIADELAYNPFLRTSSAEIRKTLGIAADASQEDALGVIRKAKNEFK